MPNTYVERTITREGQPDLVFRGHLLGEVDDDEGVPDTEWTGLQVFVTPNEHLVGLETSYARAPITLEVTSETVRAEGFDTIQEVQDYFGYDALPRSLYDDMGWVSQIRIP